ncbi:MAG: zinc-ribbon domain-containing protein [Lachnospira sp.]|nr:zinc-ribbon domain-containing protein [Lachnospira sp.]
MALAKCQECGKEISDTIKICPHCGYKNHWIKIISCPECNHEFEDTVASCPECGYVINKAKKISQRAEKHMNQFSIKSFSRGKCLGAAIIVFALIIIYFALFSVNKVNVSQKEIDIKTGDTVVLKAEVYPSRIPIKKVFWKSSNEEVATCKNGHITAKKQGNCVVTVKSINGKKTKCKIHVMSEEELYSNAVSTLIQYVDDNHDLSDNGTALVKVRDVSSKAAFYIGKTNNKLSLFYEFKDGAMNKSTFVMFDESDYNRAEVIQKNKSTLFSFTTKATGTLKMREYKSGDKISIDDIDSTISSSSGAEIGVTDEFQQITDEGVEKCISEFQHFLEEYDELGYQLEDFGFANNENQI